ncbi:MAG: hypothetical protein FWD94_03415 [Treponema sp.]|nr:hypothetical protein [Treponema sp.]
MAYWDHPRQSERQRREEEEKRRKEENERREMEEAMSKARWHGGSDDDILRSVKERYDTTDEHAQELIERMRARDR